MYAVDFSYDEQYLSDFGMVICSFNGSSGSETVSAGSKITFNTVPMHNGKKFGLTGTQYDECITTSFNIAKDPCINTIFGSMKITNDEYRDIMRWLNRREFLKFQIFDEDENNRDACYYNASFNVEKILIGGELYGLSLTMQTDKPFGYGEEEVYMFEIEEFDNKRVIYDISDEIGCTYPDLVITLKDDGEFLLRNYMNDCLMKIEGCTKGEIIKIYGDAQIIETECDEHKESICDDFNYEFFRIENTFNNRENIITCYPPCTLEIRYRPIIKDTPS